MEEVSQARYRRAGLIYLVLGTVILAVTVATPELASPERRADLIHLLVGLPFFALFAAAIAWGDRVLGRWLREKLVMLLTLSAIGRTLVFVSNALGYQPRFRGGFQVEDIDPSPRMWINAVLMAIIVVQLARASWIPWWKARKSHGTTTPDGA